MPEKTNEYPWRPFSCVTQDEATYNRYSEHPWIKVTDSYIDYTTTPITFNLIGKEYYDPADEQPKAVETPTDLEVSLKLDHTAPKVSPFVALMARDGLIPSVDGITQLTITVQYGEPIADEPEDEDDEVWFGA